MEFCEKLRIVRVLRGWSQQDLSELTGIDRSVIARHENQPGMPRARTLVTFAKALMVPLEFLVDHKPFSGIYRPISPFRESTPGPAMDRIMDDLKGLVPMFLDEMNVSSSIWHCCELGAILTAEGAGRVMVICTDDVADALRSVTYYESEPIDAELFVALLLNPAAAIDSLRFPPAIASFAGCNEARLYTPPEETARVVMEVKGRSGEEIQAEIASLFGEDLLHVKIDRSGNFRDHLSKPVHTWLQKQRITLDDAGCLVKP